MPPPLSYLLGASLVVDAFGYWPSFHDGYLIGLRYDAADGGAVTFGVHGFEMTSETDDRGYFVPTKHHLVELRFTGIAGAFVETAHWDDGTIRTVVTPGLAEGGPDSTLNRLVFSEERDADGRFEVMLETVMGDSRCFRARSGEVLRVAPCSADLRGSSSRV